MISPFAFLQQAYSENGYATQHVSIKFDKDIVISISLHEKGSYLISFTDSKPSLKLRHLPFAVKVSGIVLKEDRGTLMLDYFPDVSFKYDSLSP